MEERGDWYRAQIRLRDARIASMEQQLKDAEDLLGDALQWASEWRDESWFKKVQDWLVLRARTRTTP